MTVTMAEEGLRNLPLREYDPWGSVSDRAIELD